MLSEKQDLEERTMKKFEYKVVFKGTPVAMHEKKYAEMAQAFEQELNQLGEDGWEFVQWENAMLIFKREVS